MTRGRPLFAPDEDQRRTVAILSAAGLPQSEIARAIDVDEKTLRKYFAEELGPGAVACNAEVLAAVFHAATRGSMSAVRFWAELTGLAAPTGKGGRRLTGLVAPAKADDDEGAGA